MVFWILSNQKDERQASEDGLLRVLLEPDHDPELCEAQLARIPKDHEEVWQEPELQGPHHNFLTQQFSIGENYPGWCPVASWDVVSLWTEEIARHWQDAGWGGHLWNTSLPNITLNPNFLRKFVAEVENLFINELEGGNRKKAMARFPWDTIVFLLPHFPSPPSSLFFFPSHLLCSVPPAPQFLIYSTSQLYVHCPGWRCPLLAMSVTQPSV